jgi:hypothetical protein
MPMAPIAPGSAGTTTSRSSTAARVRASAGSVAGFQFWNYPRGHLFLGDGGAYFLGFILGALSILLVARNAQVSAWFPVLLLAYPLLEVAFSIWRRRVRRGEASGMPDAAHLHHLVYRRVVRWAVGSEEHESKQQRNAFASPYLWVLSSLAIVPAVIFHEQGVVLGGFLFLFVVSYVWLYARIARLKVPRWLILRSRGGPGDASEPGEPGDGRQPSAPGKSSHSLEETGTGNAKAPRTPDGPDE